MGTFFMGGDFFRAAIIAVPTTNTTSRAIVKAAISLPDLGFPAIIGSTEMRLWYDRVLVLFPRSTGFADNQTSIHKK